MGIIILFFLRPCPAEPERDVYKRQRLCVARTLTLNLASLVLTAGYTIPIVKIKPGVLARVPLHRGAAVVAALLDEAVEIANYFLPRGKVIVTTKGKIKRKTVE